MVAFHVELPTDVVKLPRLALQVERSWYPSLVQSVEQFVVIQLSEQGSSRLNMDDVVCGNKWSKYPLVLGNPLAVLRHAN